MSRSLCLALSTHISLPGDWNEVIMGKITFGSKPPPKATVSLKGTNPMKGKFAATLKREF